jgi:hypothetical protein
MRAKMTLSVAFSAVALSGCATINPYIAPGKNTFSGHKEADGTYYGRLPASRDTAERLAESYRRANVEAASIRQGLAVGLPLLTASALFGASTGQSGNSNFVPAVGFGTAGVLTAAHLTDSPPRARIYNNGRAALACAVAQSGPYLVGKSEYDAYLAPSSQLSARIADVATQKARVDAYLAGKSGQELSYALVAIAQADAALASTTVTQQALGAYRGRMEGAPDRLDETIRRISISVDTQVQRTLASLDDIRAALDGMAPPPSSTTPSSDKTADAQGASPTATAPVSATTQDLNQEAKQLASLSNTLARADQAAKTFLLAMKAREDATAARDCVLQGITTFNVTVPPETTIAPGQNLEIAVESLGGPPKIDVSGPALPSPEVLATAPNRYRVRILTVAATPLGARTVSIISNDGLEDRTIGIVVGTKPATTTQITPPQGETGGAAVGDPMWYSPEVKALLEHGQRGGEPPAAMLETYARSHGKVTIWADSARTTPNADVNKLTADASAIVKASASGGALSPYERWWVTTERVKALQAKLGLAGAGVNGVLDAETRAKIKVRTGGERLSGDFLKSLGLPAPD